MNKLAKETILGLSLFLIIFSINVLVFYTQTHDWEYNLLASTILSSLFSIPLIFASWKNREIAYSDQPKKFFWKFNSSSFLISFFIVLILSLILYIYLVGCKGEECMAGLGFIAFLMAFIAEIILAAIISLIFYLTRKNITHLIIVGMVLFLILTTSLASLIIINRGCSPSDNYCFSTKALRENNLAICEKANNPRSCYSNIAQETLDSKICEKTKDNDAIECYYYLALIKQDTTLCDKIKGVGGNPFSCYQELGNCESLEDIYMKERCLVYQARKE